MCYVFFIVLIQFTSNQKGVKAQHEGIDESGCPVYDSQFNKVSVEKFPQREKYDFPDICFLSFFLQLKGSQSTIDIYVL